HPPVRCSIRPDLEKFFPLGINKKGLLCLNTLAHRCFNGSVVHHLYGGNVSMKIFLSVITTCLFLANASAQTTVTGTVTSSEDGEPLPGVNVVVENTTKGTVTGIDGTYSIELGPDETSLNFTFVGYTTQTV